MRKIVVTRDEGHWWDFPWCAKLYENGFFVTLAVGVTRGRAIKDLERRIAYREKPPPRVIYKEEIPYP